MIVKVQLSITSTEAKRQVLVYDESRKYRYEAEATKEIEKMMKGRLKAYFAARMNGTQIEILDEVQQQNW